MPTQGQLDAAARQRGFSNYQAWQQNQQQQQQAWQQRQQTYYSHPGTNPQTGSPQQPPQNFLQRMLGMIPWHPSFLLGHVNDAMQNAQNGDGQ